MIARLLLPLAVATIGFASAGKAQDPPYKEPDFPVPPEAVAQAGVPAGQIQHFQWTSPSVYPGTRRNVWIYTPASYQPDGSAALMVFQDGHTYLKKDGDFRTPIVLDTLIAAGQLPAMVAVFVDPGVFTEELPQETNWDVLRKFRSNRSTEYDTLEDTYARFLEQELLPEVAKRTPFTNDPERRAIAGLSSGGICAFTVAWERPDLFRKVLSHVGSFVDIRGGHVYPALIRRQKPPQPIRVFLQAGARDLDNQHGNWPLANQMMANSLAFMRYDHRFVMDERGAHSGRYGGSILPDSLRWLWR